MEPTMPFLTYDEQIDRLINEYKLIVTDRPFAIKALSTISYYDLINGYKECFMENNKYIEGISIEYLYNFHFYDKNFQNVIFKQSMFIENMFKTKLSHVLAKNHGVRVDDYLDPNNYHTNIKHLPQITFEYFKINSVDKLLNGEYSSDPTHHYTKKHNHVPPWILFKNIYFGDTINLYRLLKRNEKEELTDSLLPTNNLNYSEKVEIITNALNIVRDFRNKISHNLKFVTNKTRNYLNPGILKKLFPSYIFNDSDIAENRGKNDLYACILSIIILLDDPFRIYEFFKELYPMIGYNDMEQPDGSILFQTYNKYRTITNLPIHLLDNLNRYIEDINPK